MEQKPARVRLRDVLRESFASLSESDLRSSSATVEEASDPRSPRTDQDRSRMRQRVLEELARRRLLRESGCAEVDVQRCNTQCGISDATRGVFGQEIGPEAGSAGAACKSASVSRHRGTLRARADLRDLVELSYRSLLRPLPEEHVVLNPLANAEFIVRCREFGATVSETLLNRTLLNNRKAGRHSDVARKAALRMSVGAFDRIGHAVEMAASLVQRERCKAGWSIPSVDDMLCDPEQREHLGAYVRAFHGNVDSIDSHLVLLAIRKSGKEASTRAAGASLPQRTLFAPLRSLDPSDVPETGGLYRFLCGRQPVFVGSSISLRSRIRGHLQNGGNRLLPDSLPFQIDGPIHLEVFELPPEAPKADYVALSRSLRLREDPRQMRIPPDLNWREKGALFPSKSNIVACEAMAS